MLRLLRGLLCACALPLLTACSLLRPHLERPDIQVVSVELRGGNLMHQDFVVKLHVQNPNDRDLPVSRVSADLSIEGDAVASGANDQPFVVPANGGSDFSMTITANLLLAAARLGTKLQAGATEIDYEVRGEASVDLPFARHLPFHQAGAYPLNRLSL